MARIKPVIAITLPEEVLDEIDRRRGLIPRSTFVSSCLSKELKIKGGKKNAKSSSNHRS